MVLAVPSQRTWATGDIATGALLNTNVRDATTFLLNVPTCYCYQGTGASVPNATWTALSMDTNVYDTYAGHSTTVNPSQYVAQVGGIYLVVGRSGWAVNATGVRGVSLTVNGATVATSTPQVVGPPTAASTNSPVIEVTALIQLNAGDYVQTLGYQSSGGALVTANGFSSLQVIWIHA